MFSLFVWKEGKEHAAGLFETREAAEAEAKKLGPRKHEIKKMKSRSDTIAECADRVDVLEKKFDSVVRR